MMNLELRSEKTGEIIEIVELEDDVWEKLCVIAEERGVDINEIILEAITFKNEEVGE